MSPKKDFPCQSCINTIGYPDNWTQFRLMVENRLIQYKNPAYCLNTDLFYQLPDSGNNTTPVPLAGGSIEGWTAPRWFVTGDVSFFYHSKKSLDHAYSVYKSIDRLLSYESMFNPISEDRYCSLRNQALIIYKAVAKRGLQFAKKYSGKIFAIGVADCEFRTSHNHYGQHWHNPNYCSFSDVFFLEEPIELSSLKAVVSIKQATITSLNPEEYACIAEEIVRRNPRNSFIKDKRHRVLNLDEIHEKQGWRGIANEGRIPFISEQQVRYLLLDGFINEISDANTNVSQEVPSYHQKYGGGHIDYVVSFDRQYIPFEAKLQVIFDDQLFLQLDKYCGATIKIENRNAKTSNICFLADTESVWLYKPQSSRSKRRNLIEIGKLTDFSKRSTNNLLSFFKEFTRG
jgi:hypothetical protein